MAEEFRPDVCLLDLTMPGMDGDKLALRRRDQAGEWPMLLVAVTAMGGDEYRCRTKVAGFKLHLLKPVYPHDLLRVVGELWRVLEASHAQAARGGSAG